MCKFWQSDQTDTLQWKELQETEMGFKESVYNTTGSGRTKAWILQFLTPNSVCSIDTIPSILESKATTSKLRKKA